MAEKITMSADGVLTVPDNPIIPFIEGDGTGVDIWPAAKLVLDAAAKKHGKTIEWKEVLAGEKALTKPETGSPSKPSSTSVSISSELRVHSPLQLVGDSVR